MLAVAEGCEMERPCFENQLHLCFLLIDSHTAADKTALQLGSKAGFDSTDLQADCQTVLDRMNLQAALRAVTDRTCSLRIAS
jgi:hypothetical protein